MMGSKILVAYDGSELSDKALQNAVKLASMNNSAQIHVAHIITLPHVVTVKGMLDVDSLHQEIKSYGSKMLEKAKEKLSDLDPHQYQTVLLEGRPADKLLEYAKEQQCDVIVMGSRGLSGVQELFLGSVSHDLVQRSKVPVLIVK